MSQENYEIIRDIAQAASHAYDGAHDADGNPVELGLKREEGNPINDSRTMDGFKVRLDGNHVIVSYQADIKLKDVYGGNFESEMDQTIGDFVAWLKKEYRKVLLFLNSVVRLVLVQLLKNFTIKFLRTQESNNRLCLEQQLEEMML